MPVFRATSADLTRQMEELIRTNSKSRNWRTNLVTRRENKLMFRAFQSEGGPHQCWVEFDIDESASSSLVNARVCQNAHDSGRIKEHILRELGMRFR